MAPSNLHILSLISHIEQVIAAYDLDCKRLQKPQQPLQFPATPAAPSTTAGAATLTPSSNGGSPARPKKRARGLLGRLLRQCLPAGASRSSGGGGSSAKLPVPLGWASAVTFNWRKDSRNCGAGGNTNNNSSASGILGGMRRKRGAIAHAEPVVLVGRRARRSTVLMCARSQRLRRSLPAELLRLRLHQGGEEEEEEEVDEEIEDSDAEDVEYDGVQAQAQSGISDAGADVAAEPDVDSPVTLGPAVGSFADDDVVESSVAIEEPSAESAVMAAAVSISNQDSDMPSTSAAMLATPQRRALDAEVRRIEEEIESVRRQLEEAPETASAESSADDGEAAITPVLQVPSSLFRKPRRLIITSSGLEPDQVARLKRLCDRHPIACTYQARFQFDTTCHTTHVVVRECEHSPRVVERTLKYFQALASGAWVLSFDWVTESLAAGILQPESPYEIQGDLSCGENHMGPARSRRCRQKCPGPSRLLEQFTVSTVGEFVNMPTFALQTLVEQCGGRFVTEAERLPRRLSAGQLSVAVADQEAASFSEAKCRALAASGGIVVLNRDWLLDSISKFRVQQMHVSDYCIAPEPSMVIEMMFRAKIRLPSELDD